MNNKFVGFKVFFSFERCPPYFINLLVYNNRPILNEFDKIKTRIMNVINNNICRICISMYSIS